MLPRKYRLTGQRNFKLISGDGKALFLKELGIKYLENNLNNSRFAFVVSTQIDKRAVIRNKIKRRLRSIIYQKLKEIKPGFDVLILTRPGVKNLQFQEIKEKMEEVLKKAKLL